MDGANTFRPGLRTNGAAISPRSYRRECWADECGTLWRCWRTCARPTIALAAAQSCREFLPTPARARQNCRGAAGREPSLEKFQRPGSIPFSIPLCVSDQPDPPHPRPNRKSADPTSRSCNPALPETFERVRSIPATNPFSFSSDQAAYMPNEAAQLPPYYISLQRRSCKFTLSRVWRAWPRFMLEYFVYFIYRTGFALIGLLPLRAAFALGQAFGFCAWVLVPKYRRLALHNVGIAFGSEKSPAELRCLVRRHFQRLGANLLCTVKLMRMSPDQILQSVTVENIESMAREFRAGKPVVLVLSHLATWELFASLMPKFVGFVRNASVYQKLGNRFIDKHVRASRSRTGLELFDRREGFQPVIDLLRSGGGVGILSDQHAGDQGIWTPFFGKLASTSPLPALLAKRSRAGVIAAAVYTTGHARWRMVFTERFDTPGASIEALTSKINEIIEQQIRHAPEDGFWVHNRWKTPRPNFLLNRYKRGIYLPKDVPAGKLKPFRILIRSSNWLGDAVMSVPAVRAIKNGRPDAHVTVLAPEKIAPVWKLVAEVDEVLFSPDKSVFAARRLIKK